MNRSMHFISSTCVYNIYASPRFGTFTMSEAEAVSERDCLLERIRDGGVTEWTNELLTLCCETPDMFGYVPKEHYAEWMLRSPFVVQYSSWDSTAIGCMIETGVELTEFAMHQAIRWGNAEDVAALLKYGVPWNRQWTFDCYIPETLQRLFEADPSCLSVVDGCGHSLLEWFVLMKAMGMITFILEHSVVDAAAAVEGTVVVDEATIKHVWYTTCIRFGMYHDTARAIAEFAERHGINLISWENWEFTEAPPPRFDVVEKDDVWERESTPRNRFIVSSRWSSSSS